jgi:hypothetical protein
MGKVANDWQSPHSGQTMFIGFFSWLKNLDASARPHATGLDASKV